MSAGAVSIRHRTRTLSRLWNARLAAAEGEALALVLLAPLLLLPAIWNRFPIIYYDTGAYLFEGLTGRFIPERAAVYSLFLRYAGATTSLWIIAVLQAALSAFLITQCARAVAPKISWRTLLLIALALAIGTSLPWYTGEIEPDCFTALVALSMFLLAFRARALGLWRGVAVAAIAAFSIAVHPSHFVLAGFLFVALVALRFTAFKPRLVVPAILCMSGLALAVGGNFYFTRQIFISRAGAPFVFARMLQDGIVMRLLDETCPQSGYRFCAYKDALPPRADAYLWTPHSPFFALGHFQGTAAESARIVRDAIVRYPLMQLRTAAADSVAQFVRFGTGEGMESQQWVLAPVFAHLIPRQSPAYLAARQQHGEFHFGLIRKFQNAIGFLALIGLGGLLVWTIRRRDFAAAALPAFVLLALASNAIICGVLSGPHDRYQSRLMWLAPFAVMLSLRDRISCPTVGTMSHGT